MNEHIKAIRGIAEFIGAEFDGTSADRLEHHADALAAQLAGAEARCQRYERGIVHAIDEWRADLALTDLRPDDIARLRALAEQEGRDFHAPHD